MPAYYYERLKHSIAESNTIRHILVHEPSFQCQVALELGPSNHNTALQYVRFYSGGMFAPFLTLLQVQRLACTHMSDRAARAHTILSFRVECKLTEIGDDGSEVQTLTASTLRIADLAGSEQAEETLRR